MNKININSTIKCKDFGKIVEEKMWYLSVVRGDLIEVATEDGMGTDFVCSILLSNFFTNDVYELKHKFVGCMTDFSYEDEDIWVYENSFNKATKFMNKIMENGKVDLNNWNKVEE